MKLWIEGIKQIVKELGTTELDLSIEVCKMREWNRASGYTLDNIKHEIDTDYLRFGARHT